MTKKAYRRYKRGEYYYAHNNATGEQVSLRTKDEDEADRLLHAMNEACRDQIVQRAMAHAYLRAADESAAIRTWNDVMDEGAKTKKGSTLIRWEWAARSKSFDSIRNLKLVETRAEHFVAVLAKGTVSTNVFLRRLHNLALDLDWIFRPVLPKHRWPKVQFRDKRAVTLEEHQRVVAGEKNPEWRAFYNLLWHLGGAQTDIANLRAENVNWKEKVISFRRRKTGTPVRIRFGDEVAGILRELSDSGLLLPSIAVMKHSDRGIAFTRRCKLVGVSGVSLHCYRYAWAERAREAGYPERAAQEALGQSKAVHQAYAKNAQPNVPDLDTFSKTREKVVAVEFSPPVKPEGKNLKEGQIAAA